jgi:hypothetical protein
MNGEYQPTKQHDKKPKESGKDQTRTDFQSSFIVFLFEKRKREGQSGLFWWMVSRSDNDGSAGKRRLFLFFVCTRHIKLDLVLLLPLLSLSKLRYLVECYH